MKKIFVLLILCVFVLGIAGCGTTGGTADYPAAIMVEGTVYYKSAAAMPVEVDESTIIGYTESFTDKFPEKDGETNFNRETGMPYAKVEGGMAVLYENEWYLCTPKDAETSADQGPLITVESNGEQVQPCPLFLWAQTWTERGWLNADGANFLEIHSEFSEEIPVITYGDDFEIHYRDGVSFLYLSVYNANFERIHHNVEQSVLSELEDGEYYIGFVVDEQGKYIESEKDYEMKGYECILRLIK